MFSTRAALKVAMRLVVAIGFASTIAPPVAAQDSQQSSPDASVLNFFRKTEVSGFADLYYTYDFNKPGRACATVAAVAVFNCLYNFNVAHNAFSLNLAEVALEKKPAEDSRGGFRVDLDYGPTTTYVHGTEPGGTAVYQNIQQAYVSYLAPAGAGLQLDFGKFVTWNGQEVIETKDNWNYSRGLLFAWAIPYYHTGMRAAYAISDKVSVTGFLVNGWNNSAENNTGKTVGAQLMIKPTAALMLLTNYTGGPEQNNDNDDWRHLSDSIVTFTVNKVTLAGNYDYAQDTVAGSTVKWQGVAGYIRYQANDWFAVTPRVEYFDDRDGFSTGAAQKVKEATVTAEVKSKDGILMRIEYRRDMSDVPFFVKKAARALVKNQDTFTVGAVYVFNSRQ